MSGKQSFFNLCPCSVKAKNTTLIDPRSKQLRKVQRDIEKPTTLQRFSKKKKNFKLDYKSNIRV